MPASSSRLGGRVVVGRDHRDPLAVGVHPGDVDDGQAAGLGGLALTGWVPPAAGRRRYSLRRGIRASSARRPPGPGCGRRPRAWAGAGGRAAVPSAARIVTRLVSVPKPEPCSVTSFATSRSTPLQASLPAARASRSRRRSRPVPGRAREPAAPPRPLEAAIEPADPGQEVGVGTSRSVRPASVRRILAAAGLGRAEVGHGGGHDQGVEAGPPPGSSARSSSAAPMAAAVSARITATASGSGTLTVAATRVTRAPRSRAASATAMPILPDERLPMKRTGSIGSAVPPAVTTTCRPARSASRGIPATSERGPAAGARRGTDRPVADRGDDGVDDLGQLGEPARPDLARGERPADRVDDRGSRRGADARRWPGSPGGRTSRRPSPGRRRPGPGSPGRWP